jgi:EIN3-binding F-box protein
MGLNSFNSDHDFINYCQSNVDIDRFPPKQSLQNISDEGFKSGIEKCKKLCELFIFNNNKISDLTAVAVNCRNLSSLKLFAIQKITDRGLEAIALTCQDLTKLLLGDLPLITGEILDLFGKHAKLAKLSIYFLWKLKPNSIENLLQNLKTLRGITLVGNRFTNDTSVSLIDNINNLRKIHVKCAPITDSFIEKLADKGQNLEKLKFVNTQITEVGVEILQTRFPNLRKLVLKGNPKLQDFHIDTNKNPNLEIIFQN